MRRWSVAILATLAATTAAQETNVSGSIDRVQRELLRPAWAEGFAPPLTDIRFGLEIWQWIALLILLLASLVAGFLVRQIVTLSLRARYRVPGLEFSQSSKRGTRRAAALLVAVGIWFLALPELGLPPHTWLLIERIVQLTATLASIWLLASLWNALCDLLLHRSQTIDQRAERLLVPVTRKFVTAIIVTGGLLALLALIGVNVLGIIAGLGIGGLALALAAKDSVENLIGSLTILFDMPFALGDWVKIDKVEGIVEQINLRSTRIRTFEDSLITLPNSNLIRASVENFGSRRFRRQKFVLRLSHDSDPEQVDSFSEELRAHIAQLEGIVPEKTVVELNEITDQWIGILVICFLDANSATDELKLRSRLMSQILRIAKTRGLKFAATNPVASPPDPGTSGQAESVLPKVE
ncbi:MAG: MscS family rane protein [Fimbriimonadaceae bacterium]|jgi:MscS family membrane protein|nr:MscS family rane protein [Fimbriimonadaceae bacterium]